VSDGALREGLLYDLLGRLQHEDARERSVMALAARYNVDHGQAEHVAKTAANLHAQVAEAWQLQSNLATKAVVWAAQLHEIGLDISHDGFERHGAYVAQYADMPGFPRSEQLLLSFLIASQRSSISRARLKPLPEAWREKALKLAIVLRLAVLLNRSRSAPELDSLRALASGNALSLEFPPGWLDSNPLTVADLTREQGYLRSVRHKLTFR
jgi:exopolyphosphatase/guanosine-5'-triphosphate,3'-diphosphate pyrophosphatase